MAIAFYPPTPITYRIGPLVDTRCGMPLVPPPLSAFGSEVFKAMHSRDPQSGYVIRATFTVSRWPHDWCRYLLVEGDGSRYCAVVVRCDVNISIKQLATTIEYVSLGVVEEADSPLVVSSPGE